MKHQANIYPSLTKSYKNVYPFKIGTTSFIYPDLYVPNVKMLGPFVDEIELLLFESAPVASLLSKAVIYDLQLLSQILHISYNVHLPTDISISDPNPVKQEQAIDMLVSIMERVAPLSPSTHTLHVACPVEVTDRDHLRRWQDAVFRNLEKIVHAGVPADRIAIENLEYPIEIIYNIITDLKMSMCLDIGHLIVQGHDIPTVFKTYAKKISIIHLHGVKDNRDHLPLAMLPQKITDQVIRVLKEFSGTVSLEVFRFEHLNSSLDYLARSWNPAESGSGI